MANITEEQLQKEFRRLDKDDSKFITVDELRQYYLPMQEMLGISNALAEQEILGFMKRLDDDGNRKISFEEFKKFLSKS